MKSFDKSFKHTSLKIFVLLSAVHKPSVYIPHTNTHSTWSPLTPHPDATAHNSLLLNQEQVFTWDKQQRCKSPTMLQPHPPSPLLPSSYCFNFWDSHYCLLLLFSVSHFLAEKRQTRIQGWVWVEFKQEKQKQSLLCGWYLSFLLQLNSYMHMDYIPSGTASWI